MKVNLSLRQKLLIGLGCEVLLLPFFIVVSIDGGNRLLFQFTCLTFAIACFVIADVQEDNLDDAG